MSDFIYGRNPILEALNEGVRIDSLLIQNGIEGSAKKVVGKAREKGIKIKYASKKDLDRITDANHQGIIAFVEVYRYAQINDMLNSMLNAEEKPFVVVLDGIEDPHNMGAIIRTAEAAGVQGVIIPENRSASVNETVVKTSTGAVFHMPVAKVTNLSRTIDTLKDKGFWIYGLDMDGADYYKEDLTGPVALVVGSEGNGLSRLVKEKCDVIMSIPMMGKTNSLNASNAAAIAIYEVRKQRNDNR